MRKYAVLFLLFTVFLSADDNRPAAATISIHDLKPEPQHTRVSQLVSYLLTHQHYLKKQIDDSLSSQTFDHLIDRLDYNRMYFLQSDIDKFEKFRFKLDDYLRSGRVAPAYEIFNVYEQRFAERLAYVYKRLETEFDYSKDEYLETDREHVPWPKNNAELDDVWRKQLKNTALNLKLAGKEWPKIQETLHKRYERMQRNVEQFQSEDVFQLLMNALAESFDPHTNYFSPKNFDDFKISMSQSLEGIGARLMTENEYTKVAEIIVGGPADKGKDLFANDRIVSVGQDIDGELVDVVGWRIDDVVQLIRGKKGTIVRLEVLRAGDAPDAKTDTVTILRDKVKLEDRSAKADTLNIRHEGKPYTFGVINVPSFYSDFEAMRRGDPDYKSTTRDVRRLITELNQYSISGLIIDLRRNGGGFLNEAVDLTGLFIDRGPVVQVRNATGRVNVEWDTDSGTAYDGALLVLVDRLSASASEIFAAAIQDYKRGLIVGSQTFGKGTVQNPVDLNRFKKTSGDRWGQLKLTTAKFYRINGGSTQNAGVMPDVTMPSRFALMDIGEDAQNNALIWDQIDALDFRSYANVNSELMHDLQIKHDVRINGEKKFDDYLESLEEFKANRDKKQISLQEARRKAERDSKKEDKSLAKIEGHGTSGDSTMADTGARPKKKVNKDILMKESAQILADYLEMMND